MAGIHNELGPEVKISLTESWIVASQRAGVFPVPDVLRVGVAHKGRRECPAQFITFNGPDGHFNRREVGDMCRLDSCVRLDVCGSDIVHPQLRHSLTTIRSLGHHHR